MTDDMMSLRALMEKSPDADFLVSGHHQGQRPSRRANRPER